ncbi:MAG: fasciclin domain-containing protein [Pseudonocardiaceae bacterium]
MRKIQRLAAVGAAAVLTAVVGACSNAQEPAIGGQPNEAPISSPSTVPGNEATASKGGGVTQISNIFGPACDQIPREGDGSAQGMVDDPVATAAGHNPQLTTLTKAIKVANLGDTLNSAPTLTVFAPADSAFQQFEAKNPGMLNRLTTASDAASTEGQLAKILKYHVVGQRYDAAGLVQAGTVESLQGGNIKIGGTPAAPTVNGAQVMCGNIPTKNATVFVIGQVLSPPAT